MRRTTIGILFGGTGEEHPVSVKSARQVAAHLDPARYRPVFVGIDPAGGWWRCPGPDLDDPGRRPVVLSPDRRTHGLLVLGDGVPEVVRLDVVLPVLHGRPGEDGAVQGLLEMAGIPYAGCDVPASVLAIDKALTYLVVAAAGVAVPAFRILAPGEQADPDGFTYPVFVKPARSGSSFGVTRVEAAAELAQAVAAARRYDAKVLVEQAVIGREVGCAVLGSGPELRTGELDQVDLSHGFFRPHQEESPEQGSDNATVTVPAPLPPETARRVREGALAVYRALGCRGLARVDLFLTDDDRVVLNEVNTFPGLTSYSRYPRMMAAAGLPLGAVLDRLVDLALAEAGRG